MCVCVEGGGIPEKLEEKEVAKEREREREGGVKNGRRVGFKTS